MKTMKTILLCAAVAALAASSPAQADVPAAKTAQAEAAARGKGLTEARKAKFNLPVLTVRNRMNGKPKGSCQFLPLEISLSGGDAPLRVSFSDDTPDGSGQTIRNSLWTAALTAALQKESALRGVRISLDFKGGLDGPSAGAVMCLGIMTALDGRDFPDDFAMTGTILPDGTVGLVGGVPEKLDAAAKNPKIKRVAIPAFERFAKNADNEWVDLFELGRSLGLELRPVESIGDAYRFLHGEAPEKPAPVSALMVCREEPAFEAAAADIFLKRDSALRTRLAGLSSNDLASVTGGWEWNYISPANAESRFSEGAIFDALNLIQRADANLSAYLESWKFYRNFDKSFRERAAGKKNGSEKMKHEWPVETQLAYVDGFRAKITDLCERVLGWKRDSDNESDEESGNDDEPWRGLVPENGSSDLAAQLNSLVERVRAEGTYRYMDRRTFDRSELEAALRNGDRSIYDEIDYDRKKLYFLMCGRFRRPSFTDVPLPIINAGPEAGAAMDLFRNAWSIVDKTVETDVVDDFAARAGVHKNEVRRHLIGKNLDYAVYDAANRWGKVFLALWDETVADGTEFEYPTWTTANYLFNCAELFAEASAQQLALDNETDNASFTAFVTDRARETALRSMDACRKAGIPCFGAVLSFQKAERSRADRSGSATGILADYWKATMTAKALVMAFKNGVGPAQGFAGYWDPQDEIDAKAAMSAMLDAFLNAEAGPLFDSLPDSMSEALSLCAATAAQHADEATWNAFQEVLKQGGFLLLRQSGVLADLMLESDDPPPLLKETAETVVANWGERLLGVARAATREKVAAGNLGDVLRAPRGQLKNDAKQGGAIPLPALTTQRNDDGSITVSVPEWKGKPTLWGTLNSSTVFRRFDGKMVAADLIPADPETMKADSEAAAKEFFAGEGTPFILQMVSETLKTASKAKDREAFEAVFDSLFSFFGDSDAK